MLEHIRDIFRDGGGAAWGLAVSVPVVFGLSTGLVVNTANVRYERDINRIVFNHNEELLSRVMRQVGADSSEARVDSTISASPGDKPYIVVSVADHRLWYKQGDQVLFTTRVATGSGKTLEKEAGNNVWRFETPRGRLVVQSKDVEPIWVPPDWHYIELAKKKGLGVVRLNRGDSLVAPDSTVLTVEGNDVVRRYPDGRVLPLESGEGHEIVVGGNIVIPPYGTNQRKFRGVLGTNRLNLGDGYALHGTDVPTSIGQSVSHGCVRLRNEDIETLFQMVPVGTSVYIY